MPVLLWITFWSTMMGAAACIGDVSRPIPARPPERPDRGTKESSGIDPELTPCSLCRIDRRLWPASLNQKRLSTANWRNEAAA
jgi:hypothetical protein